MEHKSIKHENEKLYIGFAFHHFLKYFQREGITLLFIKPHSLTLVETLEEFKNFLMDKELFNDIEVYKHNHQKSSETKIDTFSFYDDENKTEDYLYSIKFKIKKSENKGNIEKYYVDLNNLYVETIVQPYYIKERSIFIDILGNLYEMNGSSFDISSNFFKGTKEVHFMRLLLIFIFLGIIVIEGVPIMIQNGGGYNFTIKLKGELLLKLEENLKIKNAVYDKIFDENYKQVTVKRKNGVLNLLESDFEISGNNIKFVELKDMYPFSEIKTGVHKGKVSSYKIKEKIKLDIREEEI